MQCKDIPDLPILEFLARLARGEIASSFESQCEESVNGIVTWYSPRGALWEGCNHGVPHAMPQGIETPTKLVKAKMDNLIRRGLVDGCTCGCRGDFELTDKGRQYLAEQAKERP